MRDVRIVTLVVTVATVLLVSTAFAEIPQMINYQGRLIDSTGGPVPDDDYQMSFTIYDADVGANDLWTSGSQMVTVTNGSFIYLFGSG